jgi:hypothetical protein
MVAAYEAYVNASDDYEAAYAAMVDACSEESHDGD